MLVTMTTNGRNYGRSSCQKSLQLANQKAAKPSRPPVSRGSALIRNYQSSQTPPKFELRQIIFKRKMTDYSELPWFTPAVAKLGLAIFHIVTLIIMVYGKFTFDDLVFIWNHVFRWNYTEPEAEVQNVYPYPATGIANDLDH